MKPWEQHAAVMSIPRFDYNAPAALLHDSYSGFLVTCPIKREKSATKEAMSILQKYIGSASSLNYEILEESDANVASKRRKKNIGELDGEWVDSVESKNDAFASGEIACSVVNGSISEDSSMFIPKSDTNVERPVDLSLIKLTRSGLLLFTFPKDSALNVVDIVLKIVQSLESGSLRSLLWCHRVQPIQATCSLDENSLSTIVSKLVAQFLNDQGKTSAQPLKFAVGYNRRGIEVEGANGSSGNPCSVPLLDRNKCFEVVAAAVKGVVANSVVDLKSPELSVLVELLPLSGMPKGSIVAGLSVLPHNLITAKPRLCMKALVSGADEEKLLISSQDQAVKN